jgi:protein-S-isoprenylcysteine O-methyltransferase Ste14
MESSTTKRDSRIRIPVPWMYTLAYLLGIVIQLIVPVTIKSASIELIVLTGGILLTANGALLMVWPQLIFRKHHTTTVPSETPTAFVSSGPFRFSRNPMYLGLFLFFAGLSLEFTFVWSILLLIFVMYYVNSKVIPAEEEQLRKNFGEAYDQYSRRVRRWI